VKARARYVVAKTDRRQRDETEIETNEKVPAVLVATANCRATSNSVLTHHKSAIVHARAKLSIVNVQEGTLIKLSDHVQIFIYRKD